jgi:Leucine-rich repeat (LRR) protein
MPLSNLKELRELGLDENEIVDLIPVSNLTKLAELRLRKNKIYDLRPISALVNLTDLSLGGNQIVDLTPLSELMNLKSLGLGANRISDLKPLLFLDNIVKLYLEFNQIIDWSPVAHIKDVRGRPDSTTNGCMAKERKQFDTLVEELNSTYMSEINANAKTLLGDIFGERSDAFIAINESNISTLLVVLESLRPQDKYLIINYYGIGCSKTALKNISLSLKNMGLPYSNLSPLRKRVLRKLMHPSRSKRLREYFK